MNGQVFNWRYLKEQGLIFLIVYKEMFPVTGIEDLLRRMESEWSKKFQVQAFVKNDIYYFIPDFENHFGKLINDWESKKDPRKPRKDDDKRQIETPEPTGDKKEHYTSSHVEGNRGTTNETADNTLKAEENKYLDVSKSAPALHSGNKGKSGKDIAAKLAKRKSEANSQSSREELPLQSNIKPENSKKPKKGTKWDINNKISQKDMDELDYFKTSQKSKESERKIDYSLMEGDDVNREMEASFSLDSDDEDKKHDKNVKKGGLLSMFTSTIKNFTGNKVMTAEDLEPVLNKFKYDLMAKNVAEEIARKICSSIQEKLVGRKTESFSSITKTVKNTFEETLTRILTPKKHIDIISEALKCREKGKPYVGVFIGVNGVGKSTNLAKVAYLFKSNKFSVMLVACDNFRAGAIEQILTHGRNLEIPVFERGYKDDPANIAAAAYREAQMKKIDVILIDTAGRMQDNEPLMKSLSRLVSMNQPDLITFIGEALVGNDGVDQLTKFNSAMIELAPDNTRPREIDAILISKFDTVDEKVGAAISMTYATGKPIIFVGTGQKYPCLKKLNIPFVVKML